MAGAARLDITPPPGLDLTGFIARQNPSVGVRDPLFARALVLHRGNRDAVIVACDLLGFSEALRDAVRTRIRLATGVPGPAILLAATHTHGGPAVQHLQDCGDPNPAYLDELAQRLTAVVSRAFAAQEPATVAVGRGESSAGVYNRRTPGDVTDPAVELVRFDNAHGKTIATLVNYACHPTSLHHDNRLVSADYPGLVARRLEEATGGTALFLTGAIGDVGPVTRGEASLATIGNAVAEAALATLPQLTRLDDPVLDTAGGLVELPLLPIPDRTEWLRLRESYRAAALAAEAQAQPLQAKIAWAMTRWVETMFERMQAGTLRPSVEAEVQLISLGDVVIVGVPGELFVELGLQLKAQLPARQVLVVGFANHNIGYIPARRAYPHGGYEIAEAYKYYGYPAALAPEAGEEILAAALRFARRDLQALNAGA